MPKAPFDADVLTSIAILSQRLDRICQENELLALRLAELEARFDSVLELARIDLASLEDVLRREAERRAETDKAYRAEWDRRKEDLARPRAPRAKGAERDGEDLVA